MELMIYHDDEGARARPRAGKMTSNIVISLREETLREAPRPSVEICPKRGVRMDARYSFVRHSFVSGGGKIMRVPWGMAGF